MKPTNLCLVWKTAVVGICLVLIVVLTHLGYYKAFGTDTSIDTRTGQLRTRCFILWINLQEKVNHSEISRVMSREGSSSSTSPNWQLMNARSWPARVYPHFYYGRAQASLELANRLLDSGGVPKNDQKRFCEVFLTHLAKGDFDELDDYLRAELDKVTTASK
jgi:hypothetical protein